MNLTKFLKQKDFETAFQILESLDFEYSLHNIEYIFPNCESALLYSFLMYSVSKKDTAEKHLPTPFDRKDVSVHFGNWAYRR